ncbi:hypothetical protein FIBSPDRAFT_912562 [Athelia psychrophila]|uniref:RING-type domain-containing protein n=1 Tax=Athelia psychrophila TaxID=1759441 RepID=A0A166E2E9_9AGAM|nr:hypothetical protein FIBSPDRAFT_912562 [Fibularhizoctonia sp. CBS 109695]
MSDARRGLPLLSGPPPPSPSNGSREDIACRKCSKEFNIVFTRRTRCNHCGYSYCSSCSDYQALMPRTSSDGHRQSQTGYESAPVCAFCIDNLNITASGRGQLKSQPLSKLRKYAEAYNIKVVGAVEKDDFVDTLIKARGRNGCLPVINENYYRKYSVPNHTPPGTRPRGLFSRLDPTQPPAPAPQPRTAPNPPQAERNEYPPPPSNPPPSQNQYQPPPRPPPAPAPDRTSAIPNLRTSPRQQPPACPRPQQASPGTGPPPPGAPPPPPPPARKGTPLPRAPRLLPRIRISHRALFPAHAPRQRRPGPLLRPRPRRPAAAPAPTPTLESLLNLRPEGIKALSVGTLKAILFHNHVNARLILEKSDLVEKVVMLVEAERSERERKARVDEEEERARHRAVDERRERERADANAQYEEMEPEPEPGSADAGHHMNADEPEEKVKVYPLPPVSQMAADLERTGLCVICQDEDANIAIVDCGHLAMCRGCSDLIMASSRECPLCRTRIVTEARLLRIYKT